jgi:hypothetical protein
MKPRVFVSSTYYDLKHIRSSLETFLTNYGFEPVLFESGDVTFQHDKSLDASCYYEVKTCHMMILIIGGRYGSQATGEEESDIRKEYESHYISITSREFSTARSLNMPIYIFIDKSVFAEYKTFKENRDLFYELAKNQDVNSKTLKFAHADSINVFEFISEILSTGIAVYNFEKFDEIEKQLVSQFAGLFYVYLKDLQSKKETKKMIDTVDELKNVTERMNQMLQKVGEKVFENEKTIFNDVLAKQTLMKLEFLANKVASNLTFYGGYFDSPIAEQVARYIVDQYLESEELKEIMHTSSHDKGEDLLTYYKDLSEKIDLLIKRLGNKEDVRTYQMNYSKVEYIYFNEIKSILNEESGYKESFIEFLTKSLSEHCIPF